VFVAENNGWSFQSRTEWLFPSPRMSDAWTGFVPVEVVDGNDAEAVWDAVSTAAGRARAGEGPSVVEGLTYRLDPHIWWDDPSAYQPADEIDRWRSRDPLPRAAARLRELGVSAEAIEQAGRDADAEVAAVFAEVDAAPLATWADGPAEVVA
jgi:pyruvate dehydrogenase E1 component alpha subunit